MDNDRLLERIHRDPGIMGGAPVIKGTRVTVDAVLGRLGSGETAQSIVDDYEGYLAIEDILACVEYGRKAIEERSTSSAAR